MSGNSLINLGELSKPATTLVEKISDAVGGVFKPYQIRRMAKAEADAERIRAVAEIDVSELQRRAVQRWLAEEAKKQDNIETITSKALPDVADTAEPEHVEDDWITNFFDKARLISNDEMQALWAKVLAGEANKPGTYSKRTVNYLASLDSEDARLFTALCGFLWHTGYLLPIVLDVEHPVYAGAGIDVTALRHLDDIGLIRYESATTLSLLELENGASLSYFGQRIHVAFPYSAPRGSLPVGQVVLSKVGTELAPLCRPRPVAGLLEFVLGHWIEEGVVVYCRRISRLKMAGHTGKRVESVLR
ncbi:MAG TPA: DUF2806 domain-containing protein [Longimicrobium sp.]|jgi:hypothetical protein|uniref:DUF2806 domain-containing protein n=1 Tax=Longimicrobium sp. TaxID=2029185 RepID=UPI002EDB3485